VFELGKRKLLEVATPESIVRLPKEERAHVWEIYFNQQIHTSLGDYMNAKCIANELGFYQVRFCFYVEFSSQCFTIVSYPLLFIHTNIYISNRLVNLSLQLFTQYTIVYFYIFLWKSSVSNQSFILNR